jgi:predicted nucleic acid-binding protein
VTLIDASARLPDYLIAAVAIRTGCALLHQDADFDGIALHTPLATEDAEL